MNTKDKSIAEIIREAFRGCDEETILAVIKYRETGEIDNIPEIVSSVIKRYTEPDFRHLFKDINKRGSLNLREDLELDSLTLFEIVVALEEGLGLNIDDTEVHQLENLNAVTEYIENLLKK